VSVRVIDRALKDLVPRPGVAQLVGIACDDHRACTDDIVSLPAPKTTGPREIADQARAAHRLIEPTRFAERRSLAPDPVDSPLRDAAVRAR